MTGFQHYARFYDLLYADKPYQQEAAYVRQLLEKYGDRVNRVLDAGCGTGLHAVEFAHCGYEVTGLDQSAGMIDLARRRKAGLDPVSQSKLDFIEASLQSYRSPEPFDAVTALFHVMSYQTTGELLKAAIQSAAANLKTGGVFVFDFWHTPGDVHAQS
jgi:SAM-dependent methyltransferase